MLYEVITELARGDRASQRHRQHRQHAGRLGACRLRRIIGLKLQGAAQQAGPFGQQLGIGHHHQGHGPGLIGQPQDEIRAYAGGFPRGENEACDGFSYNFV